MNYIKLPVPMINIIKSYTILSVENVKCNRKKCLDQLFEKTHLIWRRSYTNLYPNEFGYMYSNNPNNLKIINRKDEWDIITIEN